MKKIYAITMLLLVTSNLFALAPYSYTLMNLPTSTIPEFVTSNMTKLNIKAQQINIFNSQNTEPQIERKTDNIKDITNLENEIEIQLKSIVFNQEMINNIRKLK